MGTETGRAIRARQRETAARIDRLIAQHSDRRLVNEPRRERIRAAIRGGRLALRARDAAWDAVDAAERRMGDALVRIAAEGVPYKDAFAALGVSKWTGRRLVSGSERSPAPTDIAPSTGSDEERAKKPTAGHRGAGTTAQPDAQVHVQRKGRN